MGPACAFDADTRNGLSALIKKAICMHFCGNALTTHDLEAGLFGTALGQDVYTNAPYLMGTIVTLTL